MSGILILSMPDPGPNNSNQEKGRKNCHKLSKIWGGDPGGQKGTGSQIRNTQKTWLPDMSTFIFRLIPYIIDADKDGEIRLSVVLDILTDT